MNGKLGALVAVSLVLGTLAGCGGGSSKMDPPIANLTGDWSIVLTRDAASNDCTNTSWNHGTFDLAMTVNHPAGSNDFTASNFSISGYDLSATADGTIDGDQMDFLTSIDLPMFCETLDVKVDLTVAPSGASAAGTATWTCHNGTSSCTGSDDVAAAKDP